MAMKVEDKDKNAPEEKPVRGLADPREPVWQDYADQAITTLYPHMRRGVDYEFGGTPDDPVPRVLHWDEKFSAADMGKVQELAEKMMGDDPYANYEPKKPLHGGQVSGRDQGEEHQYSDNERVNPAASKATRTPPEGGMHPTDQERKPFKQPTPPKDPYFDESGKRIKDEP